jgi:hypothetical protein
MWVRFPPLAPLVGEKPKPNLTFLPITAPNFGKRWHDGEKIAVRSIFARESIKHLDSPDA